MAGACESTTLHVTFALPEHPHANGIGVADIASVPLAVCAPGLKVPLWLYCGQKPPLIVKELLLIEELPLAVIVNEQPLSDPPNSICVTVPFCTVILYGRLWLVVPAQTPSWTCADATRPRARQNRSDPTRSTALRMAAPCWSASWQRAFPEVSRGLRR
jgi:hypothetical protein